MEILDVQNMYDNVLVVQQVKMTDRTVERIKQPLKLVGVCHDPVNDKVMLLNVEPDGSLMSSQRFPSLYLRHSNTPDNDYLKAGIQLATGAHVKSVEFIHRHMEAQDYAYAPVHVYYVTFDSRTVEESDAVRLTTAKELFKEVSEGNHFDMATVFGSHYLKMRHHNLIK